MSKSKLGTAFRGILFLLGTILRWFRRIVTFSWRIGFKCIVLPVLCLLLAGDFLLEWQGVPDWLQARLFQAIDAEKRNISCSWIQAGVFNGIVVHNYTQVVTTPAGVVVFGAGKASLRLDRWELLKGCIIPRKVVVEDGYGILQDEHGSGSVALSEMMLSGLMEENDVVVLRGTAASQGLDIEVSARMVNGRAGLEQLLNSVSDEAVTIDEALRHQLTVMSHYWKKVLSKGNDSKLHVDLNGRLDMPAQWCVSGYVNIRNAFLDTISVQQAACVFSGGLSQLDISSIRIWLGRIDGVSGSAVVYPQDGTVAGELEGTVTHETLTDLLGFAMEDEQAQARLGQSMEQVATWDMLRFSVRLDRSPLRLDKLSGTLRCSLPAVDFWGLGSGRGTLEASIGNGVVNVEKARLDWPSLEYLEAVAALDIVTGRLTGSLKGDGKLTDYISADSLKPFLVLPEISCGYSADVTCTEMTLEALSVHGMFIQPDVTVLGVKCRDVAIPFALEKGCLTLDGCVASRADSGRPFMSLSAACDVAQALNNGICDVTVSSFALSGKEEDSRGGADIVSGSARLTWNHVNRALTLQTGMDIIVERFYQDVLRHYDLDASGMLKHINCAEGQPMHLTLEVPELNMERLHDWKVQGGIRFGEVEFNGVAFKSVSCRAFEVTSEGCTFSRIGGVTASGDEASFDLRVESNPMTLSFADCNLEGDPRLIGAFLVNKEVSDVYLSLYKDIVWSPEMRPHLQIPLLVFRNGESWSLKCDGIYLNSENLKYGNLSFDEANVIVMLDLPSSVEVEPLTVRRGNGWLNGRVSVDLQGARQCRFELYDTVMGVEVLDIVCGLWPGLKESLGDLAISPDCRLAFRGSMFLSGDSRPSLTGSLETSEVAFRSCRIEDVGLTWSFDDGDISWQMDKGTFHGGKITSGGDYNVQKHAGRLLLLFSDISLDALRAQLSGTAKEMAQTLGHLSGELNLMLLKGWAGRKLHLDGAGHLHVSDCDLWKVPVLSKLESILNSATFGCFSTGLGRISEVDADLQFVGQRMNVLNARTNGTIISLDGDGSFSWGQDDWRRSTLRFRLTGTPVKDMKLLSLLLSPVSRLFQAELSGTLEHNSWKMTTLRDLLF